MAETLCGSGSHAVAARAGGRVEPGPPQRRGRKDDQFLRSKGVTTRNILAFRRVVAWQLSQAMMTAGINEDELARRVRTRPDMIEPFLATPDSAPMLMTTLREAFAAIGKPVMTFLHTVQ